MLSVRPAETFMTLWFVDSPAPVDWLPRVQTKIQPTLEDTIMIKRSFAIVIAVLCIGAWAQAQSLSQADRDRAMKYLQSTEQGVIDATKGLSPAQWNFKPAPDRWSVAEVTEH